MFFCVQIAQLKMVTLGNQDTINLFLLECSPDFETAIIDQKNILIL